MAGDYGRAKEMYLEAVGVEANCVEALFNLGLVNLRLNTVAEANQAFEKLYTILPSANEALFHMAAIYERSTLQADLEQAAKTYEMLLNKVPTDPNICVKLGQVCFLKNVFVDEVYFVWLISICAFRFLNV